MFKKIQSILLASLVIVASQTSYAQVPIKLDDQNLEISGLISTIYNYRWKLDPNSTNHSKNRFALTNARFSIDGQKGSDYEYKVQMDLSRLGYQDIPGESAPLMDAYFTYKKWPVDITVGYTKMPYSRSSLMPIKSLPFWQRPEMARGYIFSRRDVGITLKKKFMNDRINLLAGAYSGQGEYILTSLTGGDADKGGLPEFVGRGQFSFPGKYHYRDVVDFKHVKRFMGTIGINGRYIKRTQTIADGGDFAMKNVAGSRKIYGFDVAGQYNGFSFLFEFNQIDITPADTLLLYGRNTTFFRAGGIIAQACYYSKKIKSSFLVRYDNFMPNDLRATNYRMANLSFAYNYYFNNENTCFRIQYWYRLHKDNLLFDNKFREDQIRAGFQFAF